MEETFWTHYQLEATYTYVLLFWQVPLNPLLSVDEMQLRNKYRELKGLREEGVLIEGHEEIYSSLWKFVGLQLEGFVLRPLYSRTV